MNFENLKPTDIQLIKDAMLENSVNLIATCQECKNTMPIDTFYTNMENGNRLIYLTNVLNDVEKYNDMKFYEFNDFGYYALIGAATKEVALNFYEETVADIEDDSIEPVEITINKARIKLLNVCEDDKERFTAMEEFAKGINQDKPYLILIDGSLN